MWPFRRKLGFSAVAHFNYELDTNQKLRTEITELAYRRKELGRDQYLMALLDLFRQEGIALSVKELDMLLLLRQKTDQMLQEERREQSQL